MKIRILTGFSIALVVLLALLFLPHVAVSVFYLIICGLALFEMLAALANCYSQFNCDHCITEFIFICFSTASVVIVFDNYLIGYLIILCALVDTAGFTVGKALGKKAHKVSMLKKISPNKSWEGYIGGIVFSIVGGIGFYHLMKDLLPELALWFAFVAWIPAIIGDLYESYIKRHLSIKDSGDAAGKSGAKIIRALERPIRSHGGYLDRIDSFIFVSVAFMIFESIFKPQ